MNMKNKDEVKRWELYHNSLREMSRTARNNTFSLKDSVMEILYYGSIEINERWSPRSVRGFYKCQDSIIDRSERRYS